MLPDFERADRIGECWCYPQSRAFAELLIDCEEDRTLRAVLVGMLRESERAPETRRARTARRARGAIQARPRHIQVALSPCDSVPLRTDTTGETTGEPSKRDRCPNPERVGARCKRRTRTD